MLTTKVRATSILIYIYLIYYGRIIWYVLGKQSFFFVKIYHEDPKLECYGAGRRGFVQQVLELVNLYHSDILFFIERKVNSDRAKLYVIKFIFTFRFFIEIPPSGFTTALWIL